jgi:hypothetical protein
MMLIHILSNLTVENKMESSNMVTNNKYNIFISYSLEDNVFADKLINELNALGFETWNDNDLVVGSNWTVEVDRALNNSDLIIQLLSQGPSKPELGLYELGFALSAKKKIIFIILSGEHMITGSLRRIPLIDARNLDVSQTVNKLRMYLDE